METQTNALHLSASKGTEPIVFVIGFSDSCALDSVTLSEQHKYSVVVRIEPEDVLFILSATEPETAARTFAEALAKRTASMAIEKDFPDGLDLSLSATQIDHLPAEFENRLPDFLMNRNKAWLVGSRETLGGTDRKNGASHQVLTGVLAC